ncbi:MAG: hypothetical protein MUC50_19990 [Myxococcota bacterium]|nr:hypothetical protein [Myxococcota bacterium]
MDLFSPVPPPLPAQDRQREELGNAGADDDDGITIPPLDHHWKAGLGQFVLTGKTAWTGALNKVKQWSARLGYRLIGLNARVGLWTVRGRRPFASPWVAPAVLGALIVLFVLTAVFLFEQQPKDFAPSEAKALAGLIAQMESRHASHAENLSSAYEHQRFFPRQPPKDRNDAYNIGRRLYLDCNNRQTEQGDSLNEGECIRALLSALPYLKFAVEPDAQNPFHSPDTWFVIARTHYHLARLGHERRKNATAASAAYKKYLTEVPSPPAARQQAIEFDNKLIRKWLR